MTSALGRLRPWVHDLRPRAIEREGVLAFRSMRLYLALMGLFEDGDRPEIEADVFSRLGNQLQLRELVSIEWWDQDQGPSETTVLVAHTPEDGILVQRVDDELRAVALGPERTLQAVAASHPHLMFPRLAARGAVLRQVAVRYDVCWTQDDLAGIVEALLGVRPTGDYALRADLLALVEEEDTALDKLAADCTIRLRCTFPTG